jgi:single-strand DNA-binding protein
MTEGGEKREETEFHRIVAWNKLAELCSQLLFKGRRIFVEGRLQTRSWTGQDGSQRQTTEIVIEDMIILDSRRAPGEEVAGVEVGTQATPAEPPKTAAPPEEPVLEPAAEEVLVTAAQSGQTAGADQPAAPKKKKGVKKEAVETETADKSEVKPEDIPF